jgi:ATP-dependent exoDNAse (exonuclease V) beta subunit
MTARPFPTDQAARDTAVGELDRTVFVEASAGTGKTTLLVDRVVGLITSRRARMDQIAAITFTEAAAAELRDRLSQRFDELATPDPDDAAAAAAGALEGSAVSTVHGFARRLLSEHPFAVGLPPAIEVADAGAHRIAFDQRWESFLDHLLCSAAHGELVARALSCGVTWSQCKALAWACEEQWERLEPPASSGPPPALDATALVLLLAQAVALAPSCLDPDDALCRFLENESSRHVTALEDSTGPIDLLQVLAALPRLTSGARGRKANWSDNGARSIKDDVRDLLTLADVERARLLADTVQWVLASLTGLVTAFTLEGADARRRAGRLSFHDLLVLARELVRDHPSVRAELHDRYMHLLVDEFQDTDPLQVELVFALAADPTLDLRRGQPWDEFEVQDGRLFLVGDPKQSIYRFRRADIDVFLRARESLAGELVHLTSNFRSRPGVLEWVNRVFADALGDGVPGCQPPYEPLTAFDDAGTDNPRGLRPVIVLGQTPVPGPMEQVRAAQAADVAATLARLHAEEWPVGPDAHPLRYADVAVLVRNRTGLAALEEALHQAGVPYRLESSSLVYECDEIRQLVSLLRAIDDPTDAVSVLAALRSPALGCGDDELLAHRMAGGRWDPRRPGAGTAVADALAELGAAHAQRWWKGVSALVNDVIEDYGLMAHALAGPRPREAWRRLRFLLDQARRFEELDGGDLRGFLRWIEHQQADGAQAVEIVLPEPDEDAIRITTMHAAKGLEFPVTVLLGLEARPRHDAPPLLFHAGRVQVSLGCDFRTPGYAEALEFERAMERFEVDRLLYVAATRARDVLVVSLHRPESPEGTLAHEMAARCERHGDTWSDGSALCSPVVRPDAAPLGTITAALHEPAAREQWIKEQGALLEHAAEPRSVAATAVHRLLRRDAVGDMEADPPAHGGSRRGRAGTAVGRAVHSVLQVIDLEQAGDLDALCATHAAFEGVATRTADVRALVQSALSSDVVRAAVASGRYWREVYVGVPLGGRVLEGFIDLLVETPDGLVVIDYKTDRQTDPDDAVLRERYRLQAAAYAVAVEASIGRPVVGATLLALAPAGARNVTIGDLEQAKAEVRDLFAQPVS